jgi:DNA-binding transcriptional LysR family regulator
MDPHLLRTFVAVSRLASFSAAAAELGYTQAAVSQQVAALENDLKVPLLTRRPVRPTEAGRCLLDHAVPILLRLDAARADVMRLAGGPPGRLRVGASPLAATGLADALGRVQASVPRLEVAVRVAARDAVAAAVAAGELDAGLVDGVVAPSDPLRLSETSPLTAISTAEDEVVVALPWSHPLARRTGLSLPDLADARWIDAPAAAAPLGDLRWVAGTDGFRAALRYDGTDLYTLGALVAAGHGLSLLPGPVAGRLAGVRAVPVTSPRLLYRTELLHGSTPPDSPVETLAATLGQRLPGAPHSPGRSSAPTP